MSYINPNIVGFRRKNDDSVIEYLPHNEQFSSLEDQRSIFFSLYNHYVEREMTLTRKEINTGKNIYEVFMTKIESLACCTYKKSHFPNIRLQCNSQSFVHALKLKRKFSQLIDFKGEAKLLFDLNDMFLHLVYERAKKVNPEAEVSLLDKSVLISYPNHKIASSLLVPSYLKLNKNEMRSDTYIREQIDEACKTLKESDLRNIYLVYPKHPNFTKHIRLDLSHKIGLLNEECRVKMIPYSFSFCTKKQNKSKRNLNKEIVCQSL